MAIVPAGVLEHAVMAAEIDRHPLPARFRANHTCLVWPGEASAPLRAFIELAPKMRNRSRAAKKQIAN